jgi:arylformamidase
MPALIDISPTIHEGLAVFPGDVPFSREISMAMQEGDHLALSSIRTTLHIGAHTDAPSHYALDGDSIEQRPLSLYVGPCQVLEVQDRGQKRIYPQDIEETIDTPRILFRTNSYPEPDQWTSSFRSLSAELIAWLHEKGVRLVGIDTPSVDLAEDKILEAHQAIAKHDMAILEGIVLAHVTPAHYHLMALPLKIAGGDAAPCRAVLQEIT